MRFVYEKSYAEKNKREGNAMELSDKSTLALMHLYGEILWNLNKRGVIRTYNSPVGDYAEWLVSQKMKLTLERNAQKGYDARDDATGLRYQIKSRWERGAPCPQSRELSVIRNYEENQFDYLFIVIFDGNFHVKEAYLVPHHTVGRYGKYRRHQNGWIIAAAGPLLKDPSVTNITELFQCL